VTWGGQTRQWAAPVLKQKPKQARWLRAQIDASRRIAGLATSERIELFISAELEFELWCGPPDALRRTPLSLFEGVPIKRAPDPLHYGRIVALHADEPGDTKARWLEFLRSIDDRRLRELRAALGGNKDEDAFHILTAERAQMDVFLTNDRRLLNTVRRLKDIDLQVQVLSPVGLLRILDSAA
jgi:predicted nucleic acid-binding protein